MKILFLANRVPYPPYRGDKLKIFNLATRLKDKHELILLTFAQNKEDLQYKSVLEEVFKEVHFIYLPKWKSALQCLSFLWDSMPLQVLYFKNRGMQHALANLLQKHTFDAVHVQHLRMSPYMLPHPEVPAILDLPDAFSLYWERRKSVKRSLLTTIFETMEQKRVLQYEGVIKQYPISLVCSVEDQQYLARIHNTNNVQLLPNGVDVRTFKAGGHDYSHHHTLLFTGNMDYAPNVDAVNYFVTSIFPLIQAAIPDVNFVIAGQRPVPSVLQLQGPQVKVTGFVPNLAEMYNAASVVVAPLRFGAGTQNKVLEAMAMGIPVVCSNIGFAGLGIASGDGAIMQTDPQAFAQSVIELLQSATLRERIGAKGKEVILKHFDWDVVSLQLEQYLLQVASKKKGGA